MAAMNKEMKLLIIQYLGYENLKETMHKMESETGLFFNIKYFEDKILTGDWDETENYLNGFTNINENRYTTKIFFEIRKQKYFEALDRQDKMSAVSILVKDLKIFSRLDEDLYKDIAHLITLDNFRENPQLASYGDINSSRAILVSELKKLIEANPSFRDKLVFPSFSPSRLRRLINQGLNWQHQLCKNPKQNPEIKTLLIDHTCSSPRKYRPRTPTLSVPPAADAANYPSYAIAPLSAAPTPNPVTTSPVNENPSSPALSVPTPIAVTTLPVNENPSSPALSVPTPNAVTTLPVNENPSLPSQSPAEIAASSLPDTSTQVSVPMHSEMPNTLESMDDQSNTLEPMDDQSNDLDQEMRPIPSSQADEEVHEPEPVQAPYTFEPEPEPVNPLFDQLPRTVVCKLHQGSTVTSMEFHPFIHSILAVGSANGEVSLWEASLRERLISKPFNIWNISNCSVKFQALSMKELSMPVNRVSWSPSAGLLGIAYAKHLVHLYSYHIPNGLQEHLEIDAHDGSVNDLSFSYPNSQLCMVTCGDDMLIKVWDLDGHVIFIFEGHGAPVYSVLPHGKENIQFILSTSVDGKIRASVYYDKNFQLEYDTPGQCCTTLMYNADGNRLFSCGTSNDGECFLVEWNEDEGAIEKKYSGFRNETAGIVKFDVVKNRFLAVGVENQIKFWEMDRIDVLTSTDAEGGLPTLPRLKFNREGNLLAVTTDDGGFKILANADSLKYLRDIEESIQRIDTNNGLIVHPVRYRIVTIPENMGPGNKVVRLRYSNNGDALLALGSKGVQKLWKWIPNALNPMGMATARFVPKEYRPSSGLLMTHDVLNNCDSAIPCLDISKNDAYVVAACGGTISLFNLISFRVMTGFMHAPPAATFLAFNPEDNNTVIIGREDSEINIFNIRYHELTTILKGHQKYITGIVFSRRLNTMVSSSADGQISSWCMSTWDKKKSVSIQMSGCEKALSGETKIQFHIDEVKLLVCHETQIAIYDASEMELICQWLPQDGLSAAITSAAYSCNGQLVYATFLDGSIGVFDSESLQLRSRIGSSAYLYQTPSDSENVYPLVVAVHPENPYQFAIGLSDGYVKVIEPTDSAVWLGQKVPVVQMDMD
ncbi:unnamed protein product [Vicia faba]|uniref:CTLH domain-containing protein n=1 Tax=Vicia faba TaxID=3906 RepID=A0AAV0YWH0_VICFA|nr:unnamed protein product [Vicia faba]